MVEILPSVCKALGSILGAAWGGWERKHMVCYNVKLLHLSLRVVFFNIGIVDIFVLARIILYCSHVTSLLMVLLLRSDVNHE